MVQAWVSGINLQRLPGRFPCEGRGDAGTGDAEARARRSKGCRPEVKARSLELVRFAGAHDEKGDRSTNISSSLVTPKPTGQASQKPSPTPGLESHERRLSWPARM
jgi:hypothetical protein